MSGAAALRRWLCEACGLVYDEARGDPDGGIAPGTRFEDIPDDWRCPVCGVGKQDFVPIEAVRSASTGGGALPAGGVSAGGVSAGHTSAGHTGRTSAGGTAPPIAGGSAGVVIVGAGIAGWSMARALREAGCEGAITMISACDARVYQKPLLSVALARGLDASQIGARSGESLAAELGVRLLPRTWAIDIDPRGRRLATTRGTLRWTALVIATGSSARRPEVTGDGAGRLLPVNDLTQYARMRAALDAARERAHATGRAVRAAIVGAGLVGCELADDLCGAGVDVTLLEAAPLPLLARLGEQSAQRLADALRGRGVRLFGASRLLTARAPAPVFASASSAQVPASAPVSASALALALASAFASASASASAEAEAEAEASAEMSAEVSASAPGSDASDRGIDASSVELGWSTEGGLEHREVFDLAIAAVGVTAQTRLARAAGLAVDPGIVVRPASLATGTDGIHALGDCAEVDGCLGGTIEPIHRQAAAIAGAIVGRPAPYERRAPTWVVKMPSFPVVIRPMAGASASYAAGS